MGNAFLSVFQGRFTAVFSIARSRQSLHILVRGQVPQITVRSLLVVLPPPRRDLPLGIEQVLKPAHVQTLVPQPSVKTLYPPALCRLPWLDMQQLNLPLRAPCQKMPAGELGSVVTADRSRHPAPNDDRIQHLRHSAARETRIHFQRQTFPRGDNPGPDGTFPDFSAATV